MGGMPTRTRLVGQGAERGRATVRKLAAELRSARMDRGLSQADVARAVGLSRSRESYIERDVAEGVDVVLWSRLLAAVGLELSAQIFPTLQPIRDEAHAALLARLHARLHRILRWRTEVPIPIPGDLRAWDAMIQGDAWRLAIEAETQPNDLQALERRINLKQRDSGLEHVLLLLRDSRRNRDLVRAYAEQLAARFPVPGGRALELLAAGVSPGGSALILL